MQAHEWILCKVAKRTSSVAAVEAEEEEEEGTEHAVEEFLARSASAGRTVRTCRASRSVAHVEDDVDSESADASEPRCRLQGGSVEVEEGDCGS
jgi:hypothetical protein